MEVKNKEEKNNKKGIKKEEDIKEENKMEIEEENKNKPEEKEEKEEIKEEEIKKIKKERKINELEKLIDYKYNDKGELLHKTTKKKCGMLNKQEYDLVGLYVQSYVENLIITKFDLNILYVPNKENNYENRDETIPQCKILTTKDFPTNPKCLILIK